MFQVLIATKISAFFLYVQKRVLPGSNGAQYVFPSSVDWKSDSFTCWLWKNSRNFGTLRDHFFLRRFSFFSLSRKPRKPLPAVEQTRALKADPSHHRTPTRGGSLAALEGFIIPGLICSWDHGLSAVSSTLIDEVPPEVTTLEQENCYLPRINKSLEHWDISCDMRQLPTIRATILGHV